jgi:hypothetical protein
VTRNAVALSRDELLHRIRGEFLEMPGLRLTRDQARRLWGLDEATCGDLLAALTDLNFLQRRADGTYALPTEHPPMPALRMAKATAVHSRQPRAANDR